MAEVQTLLAAPSSVALRPKAIATSASGCSLDFTMLHSKFPPFSLFCSSPYALCQYSHRLSPNLALVARYWLEHTLHRYSAYLAPILPHLNFLALSAPWIRRRFWRRLTASQGLMSCRIM